MRNDDFDLDDRPGASSGRPAAEGGAEPRHTDRGDESSPELREREAAWERGESRAREQRDGVAEPRNPYHGLADPAVAHHAFAALAENVRDYAVFLMDPEGVITFWGEGARLIKWWTRDQVEGAHLRVLYPPGGSEDGTAEAHLEKAAAAGEYTGDGHRVRSDGSTFWAGITLTALHDPEGKLLGFVKVTRDFTAHRAAEAMRKAALDAAEEASRLKSLFLATMSHEIRTPLNAIMAYTDILGMGLGGGLQPQQQDHLSKIRASSQHLLGIIEDVLDLSRIESGRLVAERARLRIGSVTSQALMLVDPQATRRHVQLVDAVSGYAGDECCWGDEERVRQVLLNLLSNAIKFTEPGGRVTVSAGSALEPPNTATLEGAGPWVYFRVEDTGHGIPADRLDEIFEPFIQADMSLTRQHGGTGLGLAISRRLARLMKGDLTVHSEVGTGSAFFLWLPLAPSEASPPAPHISMATGAGILRDVGDAVLAELERTLHGYVARLRSDPATPSARILPEAELEDHLASFLTDVAQTVGTQDLSAGAASDHVRDSTAIQRTIAERHGMQRARLGWAEAEIRREFQILREELASAIRRRVNRPREGEVEEAISVVEEILDRAEFLSVASYRGQSKE